MSGTAELDSRADPEAAEATDYRVVNHLALYSLTDEWWTKSSDERRAAFRDLTDRLRGAADVAWFYQVVPFETNGDFLVWTASRLVDLSSPARFSRQVAEATIPARGWLETEDVLWGLTRPSQYSRAKSAQEIDPFVDEREQYLVIYPFTKTA
ncbi:MAG: chlorite dismutase family protein, partial [Halobacteriales archaeon]|nr:chlorite dismutase family protein [Halobacteriales archaeon]